MRILCLIGGFLPRIGGAELAVHHLAEGWVSLGHEVLLCTTTWKSRPAHVHRYGLQRHWIPRGFERFGLVDWWVGISFLKTARTWKPDIIHSHYAWPAGYSAVRCRAKLNLPVVITSHGADVQRVPGIGYGMRLKPGLDRKIVYALTHADHLIAIGKDIREEYLTLGVDNARIETIPNGIDFSLLSTPDPLARKTLNFSPDRLIILTVGRNHPKKGFENLIVAMKEVIQEFPAVMCVIVGGGVPQLADEVAQAGLTGHVLLYDQALPVGVDFIDQPALPDKKIGNFFKSADIFALPSLKEGLPVCVLEAMSSGLPIVATQTSGVEDLIENNINGILTPIGDPHAFAMALIPLLKNETLRREMGKASQHKASAFDRIKIASQHIDLFEKLLHH